MVKHSDMYVTDVTVMGSYCSSIQESFHLMKCHKPHVLYWKQIILQVPPRETSIQLEKRREKRQRYINLQWAIDILYTRAAELKSRNHNFVIFHQRQVLLERQKGGTIPILYSFFPPSAYTSHMEAKLWIRLTRSEIKGFRYLR